jgi:glutamate dehydrogenase
MTDRSDPATTEATDEIPSLEALEAELTRRFPAETAQTMAAFARALFARDGERYAAELGDEDRAALVASAFEFFANAAEPVRVRLRTPKADGDGWDSPYTICETHLRDRPFIVDTIRELFQRRRIVIRHLLHPIFVVERDDSGRLVRLRCAEGRAESFVHCALDRVADEELADLERQLAERLGDVFVATEDYGRMRDRLEEVRDGADLQDLPAALADEIHQFLIWLGDGHFVFLGYGGFAPSANGAESPLRLDPASALGILRIPEHAQAITERDLDPRSRAPVAPQARLAVLRSALESTVHRSARMDVVVVRRGGESGAPPHEHRFYGLFTSKAYAAPPSEIPVVRQKLERILAGERVEPDSHDHREIEAIFEAMPKTELFLLTAEELGDEIRALRSSAAAEGVRVRLRPHSGGIWVTAILPRERFAEEMRRWIEELLADRLGGPVVDYQLSFGGEQARLHFYVATPRPASAVRIEELERLITERSRSWDDRLRERLVAAYRGKRGRALFERYAERFTPQYKAKTDVADAVTDIVHIEALTAPGAIAIDLSDAPGADAQRLTMLKLYLRGEGIVLSDFLPLLENLGLRVFAEDSDTLGEGESRVVLIRFLVQDRSGRRLDVAKTAPNLVPAIVEVRAGRAESDSLNRLIVEAGFTWREVDLLRTYRNLAFQANAGPSRPALNDVLLRHPAAARAVFDVFASRFDPSRTERDGAANAARERFAKALESVETASEDQMLRHYLQLVEGTLRTNFFRPARREHPFLSIKIHSRAVEFLPKPRPLYEVYVHSARMEGVHLRGGKVARGGIRWSDRPDDFRTEILGLMKTQMVKNAVIVPVGSKGGFITKRARSGEEGAAEVRECYSTLMRGLLELTDNIVRGEVVPPADVVRYDDDDRYLVVAADKGTATFSDLANTIAAEYGFWLGDAFASGGSHGYDHKEEGITARGAWKCVERHFRELGKDLQSPFDVAGIGDMSGDVFGNGMLLSRQIRLRAAFNHAHVFLDPNPDPEASFRERERLFRLPRSAWTDYDRKLLSPGGMIVVRGAKAMTLTAEVRSMLGIEQSRLDGEGLIRAVLGMKTDLLFNGGIGTYVRASSETDAEVGDHANDAVRRTAAEVGAAAVAEGGNLGFTQRARVEFALRGGRINTDAIDNSGGVDLSDHEVNLKILFQPLLESRQLSFAKRNRLLEDVKADVIDHVLSHNSRQALLLSLDQLRSRTRLVEFRDQMTELEQEGSLDRTLEALPDREALRLRRGTFRGLTRPELAVLAAYSKLALQRELLQSRWIDDPTFERYLFAYFPQAIGERFTEAVRGHRLRREIIAAELVNQLIDRMGSAFAQRMVRDTAADAATAAASYVAVIALTDADRVFDALAAASIASDEAYALCLRWESAVEAACKLLVTAVRHGGSLAERIGNWRRALTELADPSRLAQSDEAEDPSLAALERLGVEPGVARALRALESLRSELEVVRMAEDSRVPLGEAAVVYRKVGGVIDFSALERWFSAVPGDDRWEKRAAEGLREDAAAARRRMAATILARGEPDIAERVAAFAREHEAQIAALRALIDDFATRPQISVAAMVVVVRDLWKLAR